MKRIAGILALVLVASLLGASDVQGAFGGGPAGKTTGPTVTATIVIDLTNPGGFGSGKGLTAIRVQKAGLSAAVLFVSTVARDSGVDCQGVLQEISAGFNRLLGKIDIWVGPLSVRQALLGQFGNPDKAVITDTDYVACTPVDRGDGQVRQILSLTAVIVFEQQ